MSSFRRLVLPAGLGLALSALPACALADFYGDQEEYVLYDSSVPPADGTEERELEREQGADPLEGLLDPVGDPEAVAEDSGTSPEVARIFILQNLRDELARALADGIGDADLLATKIQDVDREIAWRKEEAGADYEAARAVRVERLRAVPVVVR